MATLREFILNQSSLITGNTIREHIQHPLVCGGSVGLSEGFILEMCTTEFEIEIEPEFEIEIDVEKAFEIEIEPEFEIEVCNG